jgi:hypothetical protein
MSLRLDAGQAPLERSSYPCTVLRLPAARQSACPDSPLFNFSSISGCFCLVTDRDSAMDAMLNHQPLWNLKAGGSISASD